MKIEELLRSNVHDGCSVSHLFIVEIEDHYYSVEILKTSKRVLNPFMLKAFLGNENAALNYIFLFFRNTA